MRLFSFDTHVAQTLAKRSLQMLHIFRPMSSTQLATTLMQLERYHTAHLPGSEIGLVAIDSINAYHWPDRFTAEHIRASSLPSERRKATNTLPQLRISSALSSLRATHAPAIIMSSRGFQSSTTQDASALVDLFTPTHHITLSAFRRPRFQDAVTEKNYHQTEAVEMAEIRASMRPSKCSTVDNFILHITEEEVLATSSQ